MDNAIIVLYLLGILALGLWAGRGIKDLAQFSVAGRSFKSMVIFATLSASFIGGGFSIGNAEKVFLFGIANIVALWGFSLKEVLVAMFIAPRMDRYRDAISVGDIMERNYGRVAKVITGVFAVILCGGILGAQVGGIGYIFHVFMGLPQVWGMLIGCGIVIAYSTVGGMRAVVLTDVLQFVMLSIGIPLTLILGIHHAGGWDAVKAAMPATHTSLIGTDRAPTVLAFVSLFLTFMLGETLVPPYVQRLFLAEDCKHTVRGTLWSGLYSVPFFAITGGIGLVALTLKPDLDANLSLPFVIKEALPIGLRGVVVAGVISIVMSSADSFLNAAAVSFTHDVVEPLRSEPMAADRKLLTARVATLLTGGIAVGFALTIKSVLDILVYSYHFWSPMILVPLAAAILGLRANVRHFAAGALAGAVGVVVWKLMLGEPGKVDGLVVGVLCNLVAFSLAYVLASPTAKPAAEETCAPDSD